MLSAPQETGKNEDGEEDRDEATCADDDVGTERATDLMPTTHN